MDRAQERTAALPGVAWRLHFVHGASGRSAGSQLHSYPQGWCDVDASGMPGGRGQGWSGAVT
ncbi:MAG TPA: hypothetical protein VGF67_21340 [Ktedonobacteraceae bacterium]